MLHNEYPDDIMYITQPTRYIMRTIGIWPSMSGKGALCEKVYKFLLVAFSYALLSCNLIPGVLFWLILADTRTRIQMIPSLVFDVMTVGQYGVFIFRYDQIRQCLIHVEEDWRNILSADTRDMMLKFARTGKRLVTVCAAFMYTGSVLFRAFLPLSQGTIVTEQNVTVRPLASPCYLVFIDVQTTPVYEIFFAIQCISGLITASVVTGACGITAIFVAHASGQLKILRGLMTALVNEQWHKEYEVDKKLANIIEHQIRVRSFLRLIQHSLQLIFLLEIMVNTITLCVILYFVIIEWQNNNLAAVFIYALCSGNLIVQIFMFCYTGEQLTIQAEKLATTSCELEWYRLPIKKARSVILLMIISNASTKISAGNFFDLSLKTFGDAMKTAGAYFNMLRNVVD